MQTDLFDPKNLIRESYRIDEITLPECRSIFLDWALSVPLGSDNQAMIKGLLDHYGSAEPDHPMTQVLREGVTQTEPAKRRGGRAARLNSKS